MKNLKFSNIEQLNEQFQIPENIHSIKLMRLCKTADTIHKNASTTYSNGDEEMSYIYFMKYLNLIQIINKHSDYSTEKSKIKDFLNKDKVTKALNITEQLKKSLLKRYEALAAVRNDKKDTIIKSFDSTEEKLASLPSVPTSVPDESLPYLTPKALFDHMKNNDILVIDCRPSDAFENSKLLYKHCVNIPEEEIEPGKSAGMLQSNLTLENQILWASRMVMTHILLMDWNTNTEITIRDSKMWILENILRNYDQDCVYKSLLFLKGGYEEFNLSYPALCTYSLNRVPITENTNVELDDIEYPSIHDITMKDDTKPEINRSTKSEALKAYRSKSKKDIIKEQEKLMDKSLNVERERLDVETNLVETMQEETERIANKDKSKELAEKERELEYKIMQLENEKRDIDFNKTFLRQSYEEHEDSIFDRDDEAENRIREKENEFQLVKKKAEQKAKEREKLASFKKYNFELPKIEPPKYDRAAKPSSLFSNSIQNTHRDFSPVVGNQPLGVTGLRNLGNTCYMNSIVQCLSNTNPLNEFLVTGVYRKHLNSSSKTRGNIVEELAAVFRELWSGNNKCISCVNFRYHVGQYATTFKGCDQQDSHEFLTILIDWLHLDLLEKDIFNTSDNHLSSSEKAWNEFTKDGTSFMLRFFYGQIKSTIKCTQCGKESATYESFSNLSLEVPPSSSRCDIEDCMNMYFHGERISGWNCPGCKQKRDAVKKLDISKWPPILAIHFKRFHAYSDSGMSYKKKQNFIQFPLNDLDLKNYIAPSERMKGVNLKRSVYSLYAVSNHYGSMESGHYTAFCKNFRSEKWQKFDDHIVSQMDPNDVKSSAAYILFYTNLS